MASPADPDRRAERRGRHPGRRRRAAPTGARQRVALGLDAEIVRQVVRPMATEAHEAIWSMGDDTPIAPLATPASAR